jgi:hypothetical protein
MKMQILILLMLVLVSAFLASYNIYESLMEGIENQENDNDDKENNDIKKTNDLTTADIGKKLQNLLTKSMKESMKHHNTKENDKDKEEENKKTEKIEGFELYGSSYNDNSYKPELFSSLDGNCNDNVRFPYTNSKGYLCMTDEAVRLLTTRGGNAV